MPIRCIALLVCKSVEGDSVIGIGHEFDFKPRHTFTIFSSFDIGKETFFAPVFGLKRPRASGVETIDLSEGRKFCRGREARFWTTVDLRLSRPGTYKIQARWGEKILGVTPLVFQRTIDRQKLFLPHEGPSL